MAGPDSSGLIMVLNLFQIFFRNGCTAEETFADVNSIDKTLMEKVALIEGLDKKEKGAFYIMLDALVAKKKLTASLSKVLHQAQ